MHATTRQDYLFLFSVSSSASLLFVQTLYTRNHSKGQLSEPSEPSTNYSSSSVQKYPNSQSCGGLKAKTRDVRYICLIINIRAGPWLIDLPDLRLCTR